jgi:hypothetical protein
MFACRLRLRSRAGFSMIEAAILLVLVLIVVVGLGKVAVAVIGGGLRADNFLQGAWQGVIDNWVVLALVGGSLLLVFGPVVYAVIADAVEKRKKSK